MKKDTTVTDAWGGPTVPNPLDNFLFWKGLFLQTEPFGLYYVRNRWYDPVLGVFLSDDPIGHAGGENLYTFANNDPINGSDPSGLVQQSCTRYYIERIWLNSGNVEHLGSFDSCESLQSGGGGGGTGTVLSNRAPDRDWGKCLDSFGKAALSVGLDYLTLGEYGEIKAAARLGEAPLATGIRKLARNGGRWSGHVAREMARASSIQANALVSARLLGMQAGFDMQQQSVLVDANDWADVASLVPFVGSAITTAAALGDCYHAVVGH